MAILNSAYQESPRLPGMTETLLSAVVLAVNEAVSEKSPRSGAPGCAKRHAGEVLIIRDETALRGRENGFHCDWPSAAEIAPVSASQRVSIKRLFGGHADSCPETPVDNGQTDSSLPDGVSGRGRVAMAVAGYARVSTAGQT